MRKEAKERALAASERYFSDDDIRANLEDFKSFVSTKFKLDPTITKKVIMEEYRKDVNIRGKHFYPPIMHFQRGRIT